MIRNACLSLAFVAAAVLSLQSQSGSQVNLAAAREGARAVAASSTLGDEWDVANLVDGDPGTTWASGEEKIEGEWITVRLAGQGAMRIGAIAIDNSPAPGHPAEAGLRNFRLEASTAGRSSEDFGSIHLDSCQMGGGRQVFTFAPAQAKFIRLTVRSNHGHPRWVEIAEVEVYAAGEPPTTRTGTPSVLLHSRDARAEDGAYAALVRSLTDLGAQVTTYPGLQGARSIGISALIGVRVVITEGLPELKKDDLQALTRFCKRGGGLVCALPRDIERVRALLEALDVSVRSASEGGGATTIAAHWITDGLDLELPALRTPALETTSGTPLLVRGDETVAVAAGAGDGRVVVVPRELIVDDGATAEDELELARRAVLWAAGMEDVGQPTAVEPVALTGTSALLNGSVGKPWARSFERLTGLLEGHGMQVRVLRDPEGFTRADIEGSDLLIALMPGLDRRAAIETVAWVRSGGSLLVLGDSEAGIDELITANEFLREFGGAIALSPATNVSVALRRHPATAGVHAVGRPGEALGTWCLQGAALAEMESTPIAIARTFGAGRLVVMDGGLAVDPVEPDPEERRVSPEYGIHLQQNGEFVLRCISWLMADD